jgi:hypothetical protein
MSETAIQIRSDGTAEIYRGARQYLRVFGGDAESTWIKRTSRGFRPVSDHRARRLERIFRHSDRYKQINRFPRTNRFPRLIRRYPRLNADDVAFYSRLNLQKDLEARAREWIGRGREANTELGRIFIRLKDVVGHGHFKEYFTRTFGKPYAISFRTAQVYMQLAREAEKNATGAGSVLFPLAMDAEAVELRNAREKDAEAVSRAAGENVDEELAQEDGEPSQKREDTKRRAEDALCTCRLAIRMKEEQKAPIVALWRSKNRGLAEVEVTDYLLNLCHKYESSSSEGDDD